MSDAPALAAPTRYRPDRDIVACEPADAKADRDHLSQAGADALARKLDDWWHTRGYPQVRHWAERATMADGPPRLKTKNGTTAAGLWVVRSNLVSGMPPRTSAGDIDAPA